MVWYWGVLYSAIKLNNTHSNAYYNRGNLKYAAQDLNGAIEDYSKALSLNPDNKFDVYYNRAMCYASKKLYKEGKSDFEKYLSSNKMNSDAYYNIAICCYYLNDFKGACAYATESLKLGNKKAKAVSDASCH